MTLRDLTQQFASEGRIETIILRPARGEPAILVDEACAEPGRGLLGDRRAKTARAGKQSTKRELTLFQTEHLPLVASWCGLTELQPSRLRRNLVISGLNLIAMRSPFADVVFEWIVGDEVIIQITGPCDPCSKMTARILSGGLIRVGDSVRLNAIRQLAPKGQA